MDPEQRGAGRAAGTDLDATTLSDTYGEDDGKDDLEDVGAGCGGVSSCILRRYQHPR